MSEAHVRSKLAWPVEGADAAGAAKERAAASTFGGFLTALALTETASVVGAAAVAKLLYIDLYRGLTEPYLPYLAPAFILTFILYLFFKQLELYDIETLMRPVVGFGTIWGGLALSFLLLLGVLYLLKTAEFYSRLWILLWFSLSAATLIAVRWSAMRRVRQLLADDRLRQRVALYGTREFVDGVRGQLEASSPFLEIAGVYLSGPSSIGGGPVDGGLRELRSAMAQERYEKIVIGLPAMQTSAIQAAVKSLASHSVELLLCTDLAPTAVNVQGSRTFGKMRADIVSIVPSSERNSLIKMLLDYTVAVIGLIVCAPLLLLAAIAIKIDCPGPVFFRQRRLGQNNRVFRIFKFRTMRVAEDGPTVKQAERNDPRVTRVGRWLRSSSLDELPQLINVLLGHMSIVGPRPHALAHDEDFEQKLDLFSRRRQVRPGITGWAQVNGYRGETTTTEDIRRRMEYDLFYIDKWSIWFDIEIIARTLFVVARGAY